MRTLILVAVVALVMPALALAAGKPSDPGKSQNAGSHAAPKVMYVLKGTLTAYTAANGSTDGSVTINVKAANHHGMSLKGQSLTVPVSAATKIVGTFTANDNGIVKVRAAKKLDASALIAALEAAKAWQVIDQGTTTSAD